MPPPATTPFFRTLPLHAALPISAFAGVSSPAAALPAFIETAAAPAPKPAFLKKSRRPALISSFLPTAHPPFHVVTLDSADSAAAGPRPAVSLLLPIPTWEGTMALGRHVEGLGLDRHEEPGRWCPQATRDPPTDRNSVVEGQTVPERLALGGPRILSKHKMDTNLHIYYDLY